MSVADEADEDFDCNMQVTCSTKHILKLAHKYARDNYSIFVGTEHYLLALLDKSAEDDRVANWLQGTMGMCLKKLLKDTLSFCAKTGYQDEINTSTNGNSRSVLTSIYSPSFSRALEITFSLVVSPFEASSEFLLLGILLAQTSDRIPNALSMILQKNKPVGMKQSVLDMLMNHLRLNQEDIKNLPERKLDQFNINWGDTISAQTDATSPALPSGLLYPERLPTDYSSPVPNTHWVLPRVLCGRSAGEMTNSNLKVMIEQCRISVFVCLQSSYTEYGCTDYRNRIFQNIYGGVKGAASPPFDVSFLHFPIGDLGVIDDTSLVTLIAELQKLMKEGHNIYIHCYGGHGRTGTVCVNLISAVDGCGAAVALNELCSRHRCRVDDRGQRCGYCPLRDAKLEDKNQMEQVERLQGAMKRQKLLNDTP